MKNITLDPTYTIRPCHMDDLENTVAFLNFCDEHDIGERTFSVEQVGGEWKYEKFDLKHGTRLIFNSQQQIIGYGELFDVTSPPVRVVTLFRVHPDYRDTNIGDYLLQWADQLAQAAVKRCPPHARVFLTTVTYNFIAYAVDLLEKQGFQTARCFYRMQIEFDEPIPTQTFPDGIKVRTYRHDEDLVALYRAYDQAFRDHWGYMSESEEDGVADMRSWIEEDGDFDASLWFLAMDGAEIAGMCLGYPKQGEVVDIGQIDELGVRPQWRKRGLAQALLQNAFREYQQRGQRGVGLNVDAGSFTGATRLYEKVGMKVIRQRDVYEKDIRAGVELRKVAVEEVDD